MDEHDELVGIDQMPVSSHFSEAKQTAHEAFKTALELDRAVTDGRPGFTARMASDANARAWRLANRGMEIRLADWDDFCRRQRAEDDQARISEPERRAIDLAARTLSERGAMTASEMEALRLPGLSHNAVRPILRAAQKRGLVQRVQSGHRVLWKIAD